MARVALVTGGMGGLGEAICIKMAALGYKVVTTYSPGNTKAAAGWSRCASRATNFSAYPCDVADYDSAQAMRRFRSSRKSARSTCWSITPASRAT
jgi:acetoacetyl-CoA reductase